MQFEKSAPNPHLYGCTEQGVSCHVFTKRHRCGCHLSERENPVPGYYLTGLGVDSTGAVRETPRRVPIKCSSCKIKSLSACLQSQFPSPPSFFNHGSPFRMTWHRYLRDTHLVLDGLAHTLTDSRSAVASFRCRMRRTRGWHQGRLLDSSW